MLQFSSSQFSSLRWRYFVESLLLKSTPNVSSVVLSSARVAGVDRADARASSVAREPPRGFFGETAALRVAGFLAAGFLAGRASRLTSLSNCSEKSGFLRGYGNKLDRVALPAARGI